MHRLVALDLEAGPGFVAALERLFDGSDAALPLDRRLPRPARQRLIQALRPEALLDEAGEHPLPGGVPVEPGDALVVATSGTTGEPKGVVLGRAALEAASAITSSALGIDPGRDRWCCCLPLNHVGGLGVVLRARLTGTPLEVLPGFDAAAVEAAARERGATRTALVPTTLRRLGTGATAYETILLGGAAAPEELATNLVSTYGLTESAGGVVYDGEPLEGVDVRIDEEGEIALRSPTLLRAYRDGSDPRDRDGFLPTGDAGEWRDGRLAVLGRLDERITTGGEKVWPASVEAVAGRHPGVCAIAVAGRPDPEWGQRVVAYVVAGEPPPALEELRELVGAELGAFAAPRELVLLAELPLGPGGKVRRGALAAVTRDAAS